MKALLTGKDLTKIYGRQTVLSGVSFSVYAKQRIGLIGRNGAGKTTLLHLMTGADQPDSGTVRLMTEARLGVLDQHERLPQEGSTLEHLMSATGREQWACKKMAARFALKDSELALAPAELSGGYQIRVKIVRMLLADPNLLILDEPVNYLDLPTLVLFENFLRSYGGALVITSHDREVLRNLCTTTWEVERGNLAEFSGDVDTYLDWKDEQAEYARRTNKRLRREIEANQKFVDRFKFKASLASRAQSKVKHIAKLRNRLRVIEHDLPTSAFSVTCEAVAGGPAVVAEDLAVGYDGRAIADSITFEIARGDKVVFVGENGRGKSTLLRTLAGRLPPIAGKLKWWHRADIGYYSQLSEETLSPTQTVLDALTASALPGTSGERILAAAGTFLFREDDLEKPCGVLSGGERARVRLARIMLREHNVLLLDEPTNHLDAETVEVLARSLKDYPGTVILVSHARTFTNALANRIYEVANRTLRQFSGTFEEYVTELSERAGSEPIEESSSENRAEEFLARKRQAAEERDRRRQQQKLEQRMATLEKEKSAIMKYYFENPTDYVPEKTRRLVELNEALAELESDWLKLV
ncbi:MAG: ABC-F family ATP-binding cassette domain-containing protein [Patescibacteria group bacterium]